MPPYESPIPAGFIYTQLAKSRHGAAVQWPQGRALHILGGGAAAMNSASAARAERASGRPLFPTTAWPTRPGFRPIYARRSSP